MEKKTAKRIWVLAFAVLASFGQCKQSSPDDLLGMILAGRMAMSFPMWSHAGVGNQGAVFENTLVSTIGLSRDSVQCAFQDVNLGTVTDALFNAKARGVKVRVGLDEDNRTQPGYRRLSEFLVTGQEDNELYVGNAGAGQVYTNICVSDTTRVFISTAPPTVQGFYSEAAFGWYFQDSETGLPRKFQSEVDLITHGSFGSSKAVLNRQNFFLLSDMEVGVYMAPKEGGFEKFAVQRVSQATNSIRLFSTEFFSNDLDSSDVRRAKDLAFEIKNSSAGSKQINVSSYAALASDPDASGGLNSATYLSNAGIPYRTMPGSWPDNGLNFILVDTETSHPQLYMASFPFSARADSAHDGFLLVFEYAPMVQAFGDFYNQLQGRSVVSLNTVGDNIVNPNQMEVVISELNWMGAYNTSSSASTTEYVELYNNSNSTLNISNWQVQCGTGGAFATTVATLPQRTLIGAGQFFVLGQSGSAIVAQIHSAALSGSGLINDSTTEQCRLTDGVANGSTVLDVIGVNGVALSSNSTAFGLNDTTNHLRRSMERNTLNAAADNTTNWHTNSHTSILQNLNFVADKIERTFGTPGYYNSANVPLPPTPAGSTPSGVKINEVVWNNGGGTNSFVEFYNTTASSIDLSAANAYVMRDSDCNLSNGITTTVSLTGTIPANGYYVVATAGGAYAAAANQTDLGTINDSDCIILTQGNTAPTTPAATNVFDFVTYGTIVGSQILENASIAPGAATGTASRMPDGTDTNMNGIDFQTKVATPGSRNGAPTYTSSPAGSATSIALTANVVLTFNEAMNTGLGTVTVVGGSSGSQSPACVWTVGNTVCTLNPGTDFTANETVTVTLSGFQDAGDAFAVSSALSFSFQTLDPANAPTVTNVVVASTSPNNGTTPYNTGTSTVTITGTNFQAAGGVSCPSGVTLDTPTTAVAATSCTVDSATQITATFPAGVRTNGTTGWNVIVTNPAGANSTSSVKFIPKAGLLITEVGDNQGANTNNDYIEIFNPTANGIDLSTYRWLRDSSCAIAGPAWTQSNVTFGSVTLASRKYFLISKASNTLGGDITTLSAMANNHCVAITTGGTAPTSAAITNAGSANIVDFVAFGTITDSEASQVAPNLAASGAIRRNGTCKTTDTDANASDFTAVSSVTAPNNSASASCP
ncbi:MAG: lamin tail domain-containing protein [Spirochaetia bacterium]|nr:lamin tail domain-containing protein [Spirochaetia bacterium]